jgi:hypothetical protein
MSTSCIFYCPSQLARTIAFATIAKVLVFFTGRLARKPHGWLVARFGE